MERKDVTVHLPVMKTGSEQKELGGGERKDVIIQLPVLKLPMAELFGTKTFKKFAKRNKLNG